jgi:glycosyltransferase involved in cell wall biosynthesis
MNVTVFIPTLNEAHGLPIFLPQIQRHNPAQILVSDGNSTDGTADIARRLGAEVYIQKRRGIRHAYIEAWPLIRGDVVVTLSPDGNCIPDDIPRLLEKMKEGYDMVVASRYLPPAKSADDDLLTGFGNHLFTGTVNLLHGGHYTDAMGIYRAYRTQLFYELGLDDERAYRLVERLYCTRVGIEPLLSVRAARAGCKVGEIASDEPARTGGERKLQIFRWGAAYYTQFFLALGWKLEERRPKP